MKRQPGSISSYRDRSGAWRHRVRLYVDNKQESYGVYDTYEEADLALQALRRKLQPQRQPVGMTLQAWGDEWLDRRESDGLHRSVKDSRSIFRTHIATWDLAGHPMRKLKRTDIVAWVKGLLRKERGRGQVVDSHAGDSHDRGVGPTGGEEPNA